MPQYKTSYMDIGGALGGYAQQMQQGYKDSLEMARQQQQADFLYPKQLNLPTTFAEQLITDPSQVLANTYQTAINLRPQPTVYQNENIDRNTGAPVKTSPPKIVSPNIQAMAPDSQNQQTSGPRPASESGSTPLLTPEQREALLQNYKTRQALADSLGIQRDPNTGALKTTGAQAHFYMEYLKPLLAHEASIWAAVGRPPPPVVIQGKEVGDVNKGKSNTTEAMIKSNDARMKEIAAKAGVKSDLKGFSLDKIPDPALREEYGLLQQKNMQLRGLGGQQAPSSPQQNPNRERAIQSYMTKHSGVSRQQAEQIIDAAAAKLSQ